MTPVDRQLAPPGGWHPADAPRIAPLELARLGFPLRTILRVAGKWGKRRTGTEQVPLVFLVLLRHRRLFWAWLRFASKLMPFGTLDRRDAELVILRVAWNCRCRYEWGQHVAIALRAGLSAEEIRRIVDGPEAAGWTPRQSAILRATDEIHRDRVIGEATWELVTAELGTRQRIELPMLIGHYEMLAGLLNTIGLPLEPETEAQLAEAPIHERS